MSSLIFYPPSPKDALAALYVGKTLREIPTPAVVLDVAVTVELTRLQVGDDPKKPVKIVVSTLPEAEFLLPLLKEYKSQGRSVNFLYGLPLNLGAVPRLAVVARSLGQGSISILLDDPAQVAAAKQLQYLSGVIPQAHIKIDMGGRRAGVIVDSDRFLEVVDAALAAHQAGSIILAGVYSHAGHSYGGDSRAAAIKMLNAEYKAMLGGADSIIKKAADKGIAGLPSLVLSAGASPTAISVQNLLSSGNDGLAKETPELQTETKSLASLFASVREQGHTIEIHAGVYPTLDLQQLAAHSVSTSVQSWKDIALTVVSEVHGRYPGRGAHGRDEAMIGAGGLALGREFCKAYDGMAILTPWGRSGVEMPTCEVEDYEGWIVGRFSQEHGIVTWASGKAGDEGAEAPMPDILEAGQKVRLWPNHACITSSHFGWFFVVDGDGVGKEDEIIDIWAKARGW
ncbi:hypothetical protein G7046_g1678 [Stylonectria norvegica]|nr:hypothetical protein G7046_g1678 [Stylonectria norvegica]